ncbi:MAG: hypothetical protein ABR538_09805, partial [Candidatus Binatia bacterium]
LGTCDVTREFCGDDHGPCPPVASVPIPLLQTCKRFADNCRDQEYCQPGLDLCPERVPAGNSRACREARRNSCTIDTCQD